MFEPQSYYSSPKRKSGLWRAVEFMTAEGLGAINIGFHVAQPTQSIGQFALRPGDEEIKKKGWWQFWK